MRIRFRSITTVAAVAATAAALACGSSTEPRATDMRPAGDLNVVTRVQAPALVNNSVSFYAKKGTDVEVTLKYAGSTSGGGGADFMRLRIRANSLDRRPNGAAFAVGDSILITATAVAGKVELDLQPSGLRFAASDPAELKLRFAEADADVNHDGIVNATDSALRATFAIWAQETANMPWAKLVTDLHLDIGEADAKLLGFTSYAVAY